MSVRKIVVAGVLGAIAIFLGATRLGFIPVPTAAGNATIMHVPAVIGGVLEGPLVGALIGLIFGLFSFFNASIPLFKDPLVAILPRIIIGITAWAVYAAMKNGNRNLALAVAGVVGSATNTILVLGMAVLRGYMPLKVAASVAVINGTPEAIVSAIITVVVVQAWLRLESGSGKRARISR